MSRICSRLIALGAVLVLVVSTLLFTAPSQARPVGTLQASRTSAVGGEPVTFTGRIPGIGRRTLVLQRNLGRWLDVQTFKSKKNGSFRTVSPSSVMEENIYRVVVKGTNKATRTAVVKTIQQDVTVDFDVAEAAPGQQVTATATSTPAFPGRSMTLQVRQPNLSWVTVGTGTADGSGRATFPVVAPQSGQAVYRAIAGPIAGISSYPSFPAFLPVTTPTQTPSPTAPATSRVQPGVHSSDVQPGPINAGNTFGWGGPAEVGDWEFGEGLDGWSDWANGTGRASIYLGMLAADSGPMDARSENFGSVVATQQGAGHATGRWEVRMRTPEFPGRVGTHHYTSRMELVPAGTAPGNGCPSTRVTLAGYTGYGSETELSVTNPAGSWAHQVGVARDRDNWHTYGVEITPARITWFVDAKVTATLANPAAYPGVALVPRLVLRDEPGQSMIHARATTDWIRYFPLKKKVSGGKAVKKRLKKGMRAAAPVGAGVAGPTAC